MEKTRLVNLPIIGNVQHGEKINNKVTEYGYFIAKTKNTYMQPYIEKFNTLFKGKQSIDIEFFLEDPLTIKYVRYNQSGEVCRCPEGSNQATQKVKNGWQQIECSPQCKYRQKNEDGKCACNRTGWLKFMIPSVCKDRIFLMKITSQTSINQLDDYITLQKLQGNSIKGIYTIFLYQKEQHNHLGQTFNNYLLDILKKEDFISNKPIPQVTQNQKELSTENTPNVNKNVQPQDSNSTTVTNTNQEKENNTTSTEKQEKKATSSNETKSTTTKKSTKSKTKKTDEKQTKILEQTDTEPIKKCFSLLNSFYKTIKDKDGKEKEYLVGEFVDIDDKIIHIFINPIYANELLECDLGTLVKLEDIREVGGKKFVMKLEFLDKMQKSKVA